MEIQETLPTGTPEIEIPEQPDPASDGLAADLAVEHGAGTGADPGAGGVEEPPKRKPGRPPIHGKYSQAAGSDGKNPVKTVGGEPIPGLEVDLGNEDSLSIPPNLVADVVTEGVGSAEALVQSRLERVAMLAGLTAEEIEPELKAARLGEKRKQLLGKLYPYIAAELGVKAKVSPTVAAITLLAPPILGAGLSYFTLSRLAAKKLEMEMKGKAGNPGNSKP